MNSDTITAISTPPGNGAIGIVRISGPEAFSLLKKIWKGSDPDRFESRRFYLGEILSTGEKQLIDRVFVVSMKAPFSYTGDDMVEIHAHGGQHLLEMILEELVKGGGRLAGPGEFTARAFRNGKMDLVQAEAVADLINATNRKAVRLAEDQLSGALSRYISKLKNSLTVLRAQMEAMVDFPEDEDVQVLRHDEIIERIDAVRGEISSLAATYQEGRLYREGIRVAIVGRPNAGKSSLLNALIREERAIVHETPGTTRDVIEEVMDLKGIQVRFLDTAGIRHDPEPVEAIGIQRTMNRIEGADLILAVFDSSRPWSGEDQEVLSAIAGKVVFYIYNKIDLPAAFSPAYLLDRSRSHGLFPISAKEKTGLEELKSSIRTHFLKGSRSPELVLTSLRHKMALEKGVEALQAVCESAQNRLSYEFLVSDLRIATNHLSEITGEITSDAVLGEIFSRFCIGK